MIDIPTPAGIWPKVILGVVLVLLVAGAVFTVIKAVDTIYERGHKAGVAETQNKQMEGYIEALNSIAALNKDLAASDARYDAQVAAAAAFEAEASETIGKILDANPQFNCVRPNALGAKRMQELQRIRDALGNGGVDRVPVGGVPAVRPADDARKP